MKKAFFLLMALLLIYAVAEFGSSLALGFLSRRNQPVPPFKLEQRHKEGIKLLLSGKSKYFDYHPTRGWAIKTNGNDGSFVANSQGLRASRDYALTKPEGQVRVAAFGDSFTHADDVSNEESWEEQLTAIDPQFETLNFGVPAYGLDQSWLNYKEKGKAFHPDIVLIGFMSENINRSVSVFRPFYVKKGSFFFSKPRFELKEGRLGLVPNPITAKEDYRTLLEGPPAGGWEALGKHDYFFMRYYRPCWTDFSLLMRVVRYLKSRLDELYLDPRTILRRGMYNEHSEALLVTEKVLDAFYEEVANDGSRPIVLLFPDSNDVRRHEKGLPRVYAPLKAYVENKGYAVVDLVHAFDDGQQRSLKELFGPAGHYTALANEKVAAYLCRYLKENVAASPLRRPSI